MGNVLDPVDAAVGLFDKGFDLRGLVVPRRDGAAGAVGGGADDGVEPTAPGADAIAAFERAFAGLGPTIDLVQSHDGTAGDLAAAIREPGFGDPAAMTPRQAAVAAALVLFDAPKGFQAETLAEAWIAARGVPFAAVAAVELAGFAVWRLQKGQPVPALRRTDSHQANPQGRFAIAARVRRHLAVAPDAGYAAALADVDALRTPTLTQNTAICFLFPERTARFDQQMPMMRRHGNNERSGLGAWFLLGAVTTGDQALELAEWAGSDNLRQCPAATATVFATVGTDLVPALVSWAERHWDADARARIQRLLVGLDTDEALRALLGMLQHRGTGAVLLEAAARYPERGVRLLAEEMPQAPAARAAVERLLRMHVTGYPNVARAVLPELGSAAGARLGKLLDAVEQVPLAEPETLPELLVSPPWEHERKTVKATLSADDPLVAALPKTMPELPVWAEPSSLPQLLLAGRGRALPPEAVRNFALMLAISAPDTPYPGLATMGELCDARSLTEFCWALFENWQTADYPSKRSFPFTALRWFGDDDTVRRLSPLIRAWPGEGGHARAVTGLDVLAAIGGDTALIHLYGISQKVKFKGLKQAAQRRIAATAEELRLTREQLGDRLVPSLGLDDAGALELDYGPRRFSVFFDEQLKPGVRDESGKQLKALPKPGAKDDPELAPAAYQRFSGLKKDVRTLASDQIARLELAMVARRRWAKPEFEDYLVGHPLLRHLVRRLVWADFQADDSKVRTAFRVAEDLTYADVDDEPFSLPDDAVVGLAHPLDVAEDLPRWSEIFADYEILQPFQQLGRAVFALTPEEAEAQMLKRFEGLRTPGGKVLGLERRGWTRSAPADAGSQGYMLRALPGGLTVVIDLDPGFNAGWAGDAGDQLFREIWIGRAEHGHTGYWRHQGQGVPFSVLDPVTASEILRDLTEVTSA
ncbi:MAG: DUF4132 domain-containing protein [Catenulisporales bacterium]|nr:DUF4132 domain-containing protein [Catenulisporales bacterium]